MSRGHCDTACRWGDHLVRRLDDGGLVLIDTVLRDLADLVLGRSCLACGATGADFCDACLRECRRVPVRVEVPHTDLFAWVDSPYFGTVRRTVLAYKDGQRSLARPLGVLLADTVQAAVSAEGQNAGFLVRVPGHRRPARGFDALGLLVAHAVIDLRRRGLIVPALPLLRRARDHTPAKTLGRAERSTELAGAFTAHVGRSDTGLPRHLPIIVVDDVMTTGATLAEATRALHAVGIRPRCGAVVTSAQISGPNSAGVRRR